MYKVHGMKTSPGRLVQQYTAILRMVKSEKWRSGLTLQTVFAEFFHQGGSAHAQPLGCMSNDATGVGQRLLDIADLEVTEVFLEI